MAAQEPARSHGPTHGNTPAAWTAVTVMLVGFLIAAIGVVMLAWPLFWVGVAVVGLGVVVGKVMSMMGFGVPPTYIEPGAEERAEGHRAPDA